jgi:cobalt/nickel transport protein
MHKGRLKPVVSLQKYHFFLKTQTTKVRIMKMPVFVVFFCPRRRYSMSSKTTAIWVFLAAVLFSAPAHAHFGMIIPSDSMVMQDDNRTIELTLSFSHPFEMQGMDMAKPKQFAVMANGRNEDLLPALQPTKVMDHAAWQTQYQIKRPGIYMFCMEPTPYWEPAEDSFIVHVTKTVVTAFGDDDGWDAELGLKTEIVPLSKPFGLYAGNVFQGIVKVDGKPVPYADVEIEYYNRERKYTAPTEYMITQTIKADQNGVFTYAAPRPGWWGFAALSTADFKLPHDGQDKDVEIGAVIWVHFEEMK